MERRDYPQIRESCWRQRLENGLAVCVVPKPEYHKSFAFFAANYGGMDTRYRLAGEWRDSPAGVAHFLEHKLFDTREGNALQLLAASGASPNAFTSASLTGYHVSCTDGFWDNLRVLLSFVTQPWFTPESVAKEQGIIGQEIAMIEDDPGWRVYEGLLTGLYRHHPVRVSVAGSRESIAAITDQTLYDCHRAFYHPGNLALCVAGDVDPERVADLAREVADQADLGPVERDYGPAEPETAAAPLVRREMEVSAPQMLTGFKGPVPPEGEAGFRLRLTGQLAGELLAGESSPLYADLYDRGLINRSFGVSFEVYPGASFLGMGGESGRPEEVAARLAEEAARLAREGAGAERFRRLKRAAYGGQVRGLSFEQLCIQLARGQFGGYDFLDFPRLYDSITLEETLDLLGRLAEEGRQATSIIDPKGGGNP